MHTIFTGACFCCRYWHLYLCVWHFHRVVFALISGPLSFVFHILLLQLSPFLHVSYFTLSFGLYFCVCCVVTDCAPMRLHCVIFSCKEGERGLGRVGGTIIYTALYTQCLLCLFLLCVCPSSTVFTSPALIPFLDYCHVRFHILVCHGIGYQRTLCPWCFRTYVCNMFTCYSTNLSMSQKLDVLLFKSYNIEMSGTYFCACTLYHCVNVKYYWTTSLMKVWHHGSDVYAGALAYIYLFTVSMYKVDRTYHLHIMVVIN
jgi:hypothetical protein